MISSMIAGACRAGATGAQLTVGWKWHGVTGMQHGKYPATPGNHTVGVSVIICTYTHDRWEYAKAAVTSVTTQRPAPGEVLLVVDHNAELAALARKEMPGIRVLQNDGAPGVASARNTGLRAATQPVAAFLDDDAEARPGWLAQLTGPYVSPHVVATAGGVQPRWPKTRPRWIPPEFDWVVGCSYAGLPGDAGEVRNPIGANMSLRTEPALRAGGFNTGVGRVERHPVGCEETELAIRLTSCNPGSVIYYVPGAMVDHHVSPERARLNYFVRRCWYEGRSKAVVTRLTGPRAALQSERRQAMIVIPRALVREMAGWLAGDPAALQRMAVSLACLMTAVLGYLTGIFRVYLGRRARIGPNAPSRSGSGPSAAGWRGGEGAGSGASGGEGNAVSRGAGGRGPARGSESDPGQREPA